MSDYIVTVAADNTVTIPAAICEALGWTPGIQLGLTPQIDGLLVVDEVGVPPAPVSKGRRKRRR